MTTTATLQPISPAAVAAAQDSSFIGRLAALPLPRKLMLVGGILGLIAISLAMGSWSRDASYKVLFANLSDKDGGAILAQLSQMNVPYKHAEGGSAILVPADKVHDVRLKLAQSGLPKGSTVGFELMDNARFGTTQFQERLNFQRGLEGELVRSITALSAVAAARVHLALPNQNGFFREQQKPSASVLLTLHNGRTLDRAQIAGIVHLVSASVPELHPKSVSVVDQTGALLSGPAEGMNTAGGLDAQQLQYVNQIETNFTKRILDILEPLVGRDNLRAQVTAEVDFSQTESTSEEYKPNQGDEPAAVRSSQTSESNQAGSATPSGVPGAASNQPPTPATAPVTGSAAPLQPAQNSGAAGGNNGRREAVMNYEVDKTVRVTRAASGNVKRLNAAVVVNHRSVTDNKGKTTSVALSAEDLEKLTTLVQESVGYSKERGDSVKVINAPFKVEKPVVVDVPLWKQPEVMDMVRTFAPGAALGLLALVIVFGAVKPALKVAAEARVKVDAVVDEVAELPPVDVPALPSPSQQEAQARIEQMRRLAKENPAAVANIVRSWVNKDA
jgi:flagellar M-ring protein FliF